MSRRAQSEAETRAVWVGSVNQSTAGSKAWSVAGVAIVQAGFFPLGLSMSSIS